MRQIQALWLVNVVSGTYEAAGGTAGGSSCLSVAANGLLASQTSPACPLMELVYAAQRVRWQTRSTPYSWLPACREPVRGLLGALGAEVCPAVWQVFRRDIFMILHRGERGGPPVR